jgi:catechol 2,3-dioxygenase-like lactoylglutathione lyase family enzyme
MLAPLLLALAAAIAPRQLADDARASAPTVAAVSSIGMTVSDLDRSIAFYRDVLGFELEREVELAGAPLEQIEGVFGARVRRATMQLGHESIELSEFLAPRGRSIPEDSRSNDRWFQHIAIVVRNMDQAYAQLRRCRVEHVSTGPQTLPSWNPNAGGIQAFYFKDPDRHVLEVICFPIGKGDPRWHVPGDELFLGIDHTAIVVQDTEASLSFFRDALGLKVAGESENYGTEQEHLNNCFAARLRITGLRAAAGPGIELLEYLAPSDGRPYPLDARANDLLHWNVNLLTHDVEHATAGLRTGRDIRFVSPGVVHTQGALPGIQVGVTVKDPDGHVFRLFQR